ncbi:MAG: hypothetical protein SWQ30_15545 [Thermodesulfobacteriota bacterium]|nr:hypothetical protein [Thermodesulfobacteriota bacterium]
MNEDSEHMVIEDFPLKKLDICIASIAVIATIVGALIVQSIFHKTELHGLWTAYEKQIRDMKKEHGHEINQRDQRITELRQSLNSVSFALDELSLAVDIHRLDSACGMNEVLRRSHREHASVIRLLDWLQRRFPESQTRRFAIEQSYNRCHDSLDSAISWYSDWHEQVSALLVELSQWLPGQIAEVRFELQQARERRFPFRRVFGIVAPDICCSEEERLAIEQCEDLRTKLAELQLIRGLFNNTCCLFQALDDQADVAE